MAALRAGAWQAVGIGISIGLEIQISAENVMGTFGAVSQVDHRAGVGAGFAFEGAEKKSAWLGFSQADVSII